MIVKRNIIRILCFGDSNTRGFVPLSGGKQRYEADQRWTGLLQSALGDNYEIIEFICKFFAEAWETDKEMIPSFKRGYKIQMFLNNHLMKNRSFFSFFRIVNDVFDNRLRDFSALFYPTKFHEMPDYIVNFGSFIHPVTGEKFEGNLLDLWNNGLNLSHKFLKSVNDYIFEGLSREEFDDIFRGYSLDVGLEGVNVKEVKHFSPWSIVP